jgi:hypothetical protein
MNRGLIGFRSSWSEDRVFSDSEALFSTGRAASRFTVESEGILT